MSSTELHDELLGIATQSLARADRAFREEYGILLEKSAAHADTMLSDLEPYRSIDLGGAKAVKASILFLDIRGSTKYAVREGPQKTFLALHGLLPVLSRIVGSTGGTICGFRGDGLFGLFEGVGDSDVARVESSVKSAIKAGLIAIEATREIVNPELMKYDVREIRIGGGVDFGDMVATRIGLRRSHELTVYGNPVNFSSKLCSAANRDVLVSELAYELVPSSKTGKLQFRRRHVEALRVAAYVADTTTRYLEKPSD